MSFIPLKGEIEPCGSVRDLQQDVELGLILWSVQVEPAKNPPLLQAMNPVVAPKIFSVLAAERLCLFNSKNLANAFMQLL